jgi:hypothetical protein
MVTTIFRRDAAKTEMMHEDGWMDGIGKHINKWHRLCVLTLPIAKRPLSKKKMTPRNVNRTPNPVNPIPISVPSHRHVHFAFA